jgi:hypothetical protein
MGNKSYFLNQKKEISNNQNFNEINLKEYSSNNNELNNEKIKCKYIIKEHKKWINYYFFKK